MADFGNDISKMERSLRQDTLKEKSWHRAGGMKLPTRIILETANHPSQPEPNCKHAEIDLRTYQASRVLRYGQCVLGGAVRRSLFDGHRELTEKEFEMRMACTKATYEQEN
jgi:hypothetical protein